MSWSQEEEENVEVTFPIEFALPYFQNLEAFNTLWHQLYNTLQPETQLQYQQEQTLTDYFNFMNSENSQNNQNNQNSQNSPSQNINSSLQLSPVDQAASINPNLIHNSPSLYSQHFSNHCQRSQILPSNSYNQNLANNSPIQSETTVPLGSIRRYPFWFTESIIIIEDWAKLYNTKQLPGDRRKNRIIPNINLADIPLIPQTKIEVARNEISKMTAFKSQNNKSNANLNQSARSKGARTFGGETNKYIVGNLREILKSLIHLQNRLALDASMIQNIYQHVTKLHSIMSVKTNEIDRQKLEQDLPNRYLYWRSILDLIGQIEIPSSFLTQLENDFQNCTSNPLERILRCCFWISYRLSKLPDGSSL